MPPPAPVVSSPATGAGISAAAAPGGFVTVSGTAEAGAAVEVTVGGTTHVASRSGASWTTTFGLADGVWAVSATATDAAGNVSAAGTSGFTLDTAAPSAPAFTFPLDGALLGAAQAPGGLLTLTGASDAGTTVAVTVDGSAHPASVSGTGWSLTLTLGDGPHPASAVAADAVGNAAASAGILFRIDATPPAAPTLNAVPSSTAADPIVLSGSAEAGASVELFLDGVSQGTTIAGPSFSFSIPGLPNGPRAAHVVATDAAGNASPPSTTRSFLVDRTAPGLATVDVPADGALLGAAAAPLGVVAFSGTSEMGSAVDVEVDWIVLDVADAATGAWSAAFSVLDGDHQVRVRARDGAGNAGPWSAASLFSVDTVAPAAPSIDTLPPATHAAAVAVTGLAEPGSIVAVYLDGAFAGTTEASGGMFSLAVAVAEGTPAFTATATDAAGNVSPLSGARSTAVDWVAPDAPSLAALVSPTDATTVVVSGAAEADATVTVYRDGAAFGTTSAPGGTFSLAVPVFTGTITFRATATDAAGNVSPLSAPITVVVDHELPAAPVLDPLVSPTNAVTVVVTGRADAGADVTVYRDGTPLAVVAAPAGTFSLAVAVDPGITTFTATARNTLGTISPLSNAVPVLVDRIAPDEPLLAALESPTGASLVTVAGTAEPGATVTVYRDGLAAGTASADASTGAFALDVAVDDGTFSFTAVARDPAGNDSLASAAVGVVVDHGLPAPPVLAGLVSPTNATTHRGVGRRRGSLHRHGPRRRRSGRHDHRHRRGVHARRRRARGDPRDHRDLPGLGRQPVGLLGHGLRHRRPDAARGPQRRRAGQWLRPRGRPGPLGHRIARRDRRRRDHPRARARPRRDDDLPSRPAPGRRPRPCPTVSTASAPGPSTRPGTPAPGPPSRPSRSTRTRPPRRRSPTSPRRPPPPPWRSAGRPRPAPP